MNTLISLTTWQEKDTAVYLARWQTADDITFDVMHGADGKPLHPVRPFGVKLSAHLTSEQMASAAPAPDPQPPAPSVTAHDLAAKGTAACPRLAKRMSKAADLVEAGAVRLISSEKATVQSSQLYLVTGGRCTCDWQKHHPGDHCSHSLAVRMARALDQDDEPTGEEDKEARSDAIAAANQERKLRRAAQAQRFARERDRQQRDYLNSAQSARRYIHMAMANGATTIRPDIMNRAQPGLNNF